MGALLDRVDYLEKVIGASSATDEIWARTSEEFHQHEGIHRGQHVALTQRMEHVQKLLEESAHEQTERMDNVQILLESSASQRAILPVSIAVGANPRCGSNDPL